jgi:hypothetical protein
MRRVEGNERDVGEGENRQGRCDGGGMCQERFDGRGRVRSKTQDHVVVFHSAKSVGHRKR